MFRDSNPGDYAEGMSRFILHKEIGSLKEENKKLKEEIEFFNKEVSSILLLCGAKNISEAEDIVRSATVVTGKLSDKFVSFEKEIESLKSEIEKNIASMGLKNRLIERFKSDEYYKLAVERYKKIHLLEKEIESLKIENKSLLNLNISLSTKMREGNECPLSCLGIIRCEKLEESISTLLKETESLRSINLQLNAKLFKEVEAEEVYFCICDSRFTSEQNSKCKFPHKPEPKFKIGEFVRPKGREAVKFEIHHVFIWGGIFFYYVSGEGTFNSFKESDLILTTKGENK
jgi:hypothetical protein